MARSVTKEPYRARQNLGFEENRRAPIISIVAPAHNEEESLIRFVDSVVLKLAHISHEVIIVDDGSTDRTWATIQQLKERCAQIRGIRFTRNFGHQSAILAGLAAARGQAVIMMDSDGQHPVELIPELIEHWEEGNEVVQTVRTRSVSAGPLKKFTSSFFYRILRRLSGVNVPHGAADFRLLSRNVVDSVLRSAGQQLFLRALIPWMGFSTYYLQFEAKRRIGGKSSYTWRRMIMLSLDGLMTFSIIPLRISILLGISISALSFIYLVYIVAIWSTSSQVVHGWASMTGLLSLLGGIQLLTMGVLGEYLGRLFISNLNRPHFIVKEQL